MKLFKKYSILPRLVALLFACEDVLNKDPPVTSVLLTFISRKKTMLWFFTAPTVACTGIFSPGNVTNYRQCALYEPFPHRDIGLNGTISPILQN